MFFASLYQRELSQDTVSAYDRATRAFCRFCMAEEWLEKDPMASRPRLKQAHSLPDTLSLEEIDRMLGTCDDSALGLRDRAIMLLMLDTGLRAGEVVGLTVEYLVLNGDRGIVIILATKAKGQDNRVVPIWTETVRALKAWQEVRPGGVQTVFVASDGYRLTSNTMTVDSLNKMMRRRAKRANINSKRRWCHIWRHTFAKTYVLAGGDLETLRRLLGHRSLETVRIYLGFRNDELEQRHWELSPVRQLLEQRSQTV